MKDEIVQKVTTVVYSGSLGALGGLASLLYKNMKGEKFILGQWVVSILLSAITGWLLGEFIPDDFGFRDGIIGIAGATAYAIMGLIQVYGAKFVLKQTPLGPIAEDKKEENI